MLDQNGLPKILTRLSAEERSEHAHYIESIRACLSKFLPKDFFARILLQEDTTEGRESLLRNQLPYFTSSPYRSPPFNLSFFILYPLRTNAYQFFYDLLSRWLIPGYRPNFLLIYAVDCNFIGFGNDTYTLCELVVHVENDLELDEMKRNLPAIESQIKLGVGSAYYARRILEIKGLASDEKIAHIHEKITYLIDRLPHQFDYDILTEMQHVLIVCPDAFKSIRSPRHLSRIISVFYLFRKRLKQLRQEKPNKRHLVLKIYKISFPHDLYQRQAIGIIVGINFLREKEHFDEPHLLKAINQLVPEAVPLKDSFLSVTRGDENICTLYLEVEKKNGRPFSVDEVKSLQCKLPNELKACIEHAMHPLFNPRNEEEIMRNILTLSKQIKFVRDIPQVTITFDEQTFTHLFFTVVLVRVIKDDFKMLQELFSTENDSIEYIHDRCKRLGKIRKKHPIEATVFRIKIEKEKFLRDDSSIDLFKARQSVVDAIGRAVGEFRDYNGGMIAKQNELLEALRGMLLKEGPINHLLLENIFHNINPPVMRSVMEHTALAKLYRQMEEAVDSGVSPNERYRLTFAEESEFVYAIFTTDETVQPALLEDLFHPLNIASTSLVKANVMKNDLSCTGYIYRTDNTKRRQDFKDLLQNTLEEHFCVEPL